MSQNKFIKVEKDGQRLDQYLVDKLTEESRTTIKKWIAEGAVTVNGKASKSSYKVVVGDDINVEIADENDQPIPVNAQNIPLDIIFEDDHVMVINKPRGMVIHPSTGHFEGTLVNALVYYAEQKHITLADAGEYFRPGIVHRLDKDTSGLLVVAKTNLAYEKLVDQLKDHSMSRHYLGLVYGEIFEKKGTIDAPIKRHPNDRLRFAAAEGGREAITHFEVIKRYFDFTLLKFSLETGRTHQIRVHTNFIGHPIADDPTYAGDYKNRFFGKQGQLLHANELSFVHPQSGETVTFKVDMPADMQEDIDKLTIKMT